MKDTSKKGKVDFGAAGQRFPGPEQPTIDMKGFNAVQFKGQVENAVITIHFEAGNSIQKDIPAIGGTNKINDTFPFPLGDNTGKIEFSFQAIDPSKPSPCEISYELTNLDTEEYNRLSTRTFQFHIPLHPQSKIDVLKAIASHTTIDTPTNFSFNALAKESNLSREELDRVLIELEQERYLTEYVMGGNDSFRITLHKKGFDAAQ